MLTVELTILGVFSGCTAIAGALAYGALSLFTRGRYDKSK